MQNSGGADHLGRNWNSLEFNTEVSSDSEANVSGASGFSSGGGKRSADDAGLDHEPESIGISSDDEPIGKQEPPKKTPPPNGKKTKGRVKIKMEFIDNKLRRYTTFSKRKTGIMKKAYELSTLTGTQVMLLVASETGHVYTFATRKLQPMITSEAGKALIQTCLNSPDPPLGHSQQLDQRMSATGFEETDLTYSITEEDQKETKPQVLFGGALESSHHHHSNSQVSGATTIPVSTLLNAQSGGKTANISMQLPTGGYATILTQAQGQQSNNTDAMQNAVTVSQQNLSVMSGSIPGAVMYQTAQGVVYATPTGGALPEGVIFNLGHTQALQMSQDQGGNSTPQQYITIPVPVSLTAAPQMMQAQQGLSPTTSSSSSEPSTSPGVTDLSKASSHGK